MKDKLTIEVQIGEERVWRVYSLDDGQAPDNMQETIQDMVNSLLDKEE